MEVSQMKYKIYIILLCKILLKLYISVYSNYKNFIFRGYLTAFGLENGTILLYIFNGEWSFVQKNRYIFYLHLLFSISCVINYIHLFLILLSITIQTPWLVSFIAYQMCYSQKLFWYELTSHNNFFEWLLRDVKN